VGRFVAPTSCRLSLGRPALGAPGEDACRCGPFLHNMVRDLPHVVDLSRAEQEVDGRLMQD
jgi:hypothetical protein